MSLKKAEFSIYFNAETILPIIVAAQSKAWNLFARSNTGIVGSNPIQSMSVYVHSVFVLGSCLATSWSPVQGVLPTKKLKWDEAFHGCPILQLGATGIVAEEETILCTQYWVKRLSSSQRSTVHWGKLFCWHHSNKRKAAGYIYDR
jgi:hypothetical protein